MPGPDRERSTSRHDLTVVFGAVALFTIGVTTGAFQVIHEALEARVRGLADAAFGILIVGCWAAGVIALLHRRHARDEQHRRTETESKYQTLVEQVPAVAYAWDPAHEPGTVPAVYISPQIERLLGFTAQQWMEDPELWGRLCTTMTSITCSRHGVRRSRWASGSSSSTASAPRPARKSGFATRRARHTMRRGRATGG